MTESQRTDHPRTQEADQPETSAGQPGMPANRAETLSEKIFALQKDRILERFADKDVARDIVTLAGMTEIYCADHHDESQRVPFRSHATEAGVYPVRKPVRLCPDCAEHLRDGEIRRALCTRSPRPSCKTCKNPCYAEDEAAWQRTAMAYSGPRAMFRGHALEAIRHLIQTRLS